METLEPLVLAADLGGTNFRLALVNPAGEIIQRSSRPTSKGEGTEILVRKLAAAMLELTAAARYPGSTDPSRGDGDTRVGGTGQGLGGQSSQYSGTGPGLAWVRHWAGICPGRWPWTMTPIFCLGRGISWGQAGERKTCWASLWGPGWAAGWCWGASFGRAARERRRRSATLPLNRGENRAIAATRAAWKPWPRQPGR